MSLARNLALSAWIILIPIFLSNIYQIFFPFLSFLCLALTIALGAVSIIYLVNVINNQKMHKSYFTIRSAGIVGIVNSFVCLVVIVINLITHFLIKNKTGGELGAIILLILLSSNAFLTISAFIVFMLAWGDLKIINLKNNPPIAQNFNFNNPNQNQPISPDHQPTENKNC